MVLFSGDGDFCSLVQVLQQRGVRVISVSSTPTAAQELRRQSDEFIDVVKLKEKFGRDPAARLSRSSSEGRANREQRYTPKPPRNRAAFRVGAARDDLDQED